MEEEQIGKVVFDFIENMDALNSSAPLALSVVATVAEKFRKGHSDYLEKYGEVTEESDEKKVYTLPIERQGRADRIREQSRSLIKSVKLIPRNFLVSFVSEFDCFLGSLLKVIYSKKPELLNDSARQISYTDLLAFETLEEAKEQVLEKEIESILRKSHSEHFSTLETKFDVKLRKGLDIWSEFIEITERRNLFVHSNGIVSSQYLKVCKAHGVNIEGVTIGCSLSVDSDYLKRAYEVIFEISVKLAHVLWRKLFPDEREESDNNLNNVCFNLVSKNKNKLSSALLEFAIGLPKHHSETVKRMMIINLAQAYKRSDKKDKCAEILKRYDWSATGYEFKLAVAVLDEDYKLSAKLIATVVKTGDLSEKEIVEWPLFREFRKTEDFINVFKELFNKDYAQQEELIKAEFASHMDSMFSEDNDNSSDDYSEDKNSVEEAAEEIEKELRDEASGKA
ncbi:hypothetical protein SAMN05660443_0927 [Marinospirillum celere]|uniref:Uncharacterized protein n=1 Tax=Marinospirillum celere TaxID=1122252 RepID=A0A1I1EXA4_9GAMM|nr:hypothetical protein [Marinospirillum celere]SFB91819.1 hypothetical protein SAMN05660443_0927 [Marinospirillum celere]